MLKVYKSLDVEVIDFIICSRYSSNVIYINTLMSLAKIIGLFNDFDMVGE